MTIEEAIKILRTEQPGDSEHMELAKQMGAAALERQQLTFHIEWPKDNPYLQQVYKTEE